MKPFCPLFLPVQSHGNRIVRVNRHPVEIALQKPNAFPVVQVNCRYNNHTYPLTKKRSESPNTGDSAHCYLKNRLPIFF